MFFIYNDVFCTRFVNFIHGVFFKTTVHKYDCLGRLVSTKENNVYKIQNTYNSKNQIIQSKNALKYTTTYQYDIYGNVIKENFAGYITLHTYDLNQNIIEEVENNIKKTTHRYDALNQEVETKINNRIQTKNQYDAVGNITYKYENGVQTKYTYDKLNRQKDIYFNKLDDRNQYIKVSSYTYDETGNVTEIKDTYGNTVKRSYDAFNQLISETNANGYTTKYAYDKVGNIAKVQDPKERVVNYSYDGNNNQIKRVINKKEAIYKYDENNHMTYSKDEYGMKEKYQYDVDGNLISYTKNDGTTIKSTYDAEGNQLTEGKRKFTYNAFNQVLTATYQEKTTTFEYDRLKNLRKVTDTNNQTVQYTYDVYGNKTSMKYKNNTIKYTYNQFNKIKKISQNGQTIASYTYDARGDTSTFTRGNYTTSYQYDNLSRRIKYINKKGKNIISTYGYKFDPNSNIISETINGKTNTYTYNENDELSSSSKYINNKLIKTTYKYDVFGNKIEQSSNGKSKVYKYNDKNQLVSINDSSKGLTTIYYDKNGNMRDIYYADKTKEHYTYDDYNQLTELKKNKTTYTYEYDAQGDRISQKAETKKQYEYQSNNRERWYDDLSSMSIDEIEDMLNSMDSQASFNSLRHEITHKRLCQGNFGEKSISETTDYLLDKSEDNVQVLADNDSLNIYGEERITTKEDSTYNYYITGLNESVYAKTEAGKLTNIEYTDTGYTDDVDKGYAYNGEAKDITGLIYLRARYYNPKIGQFIQIDSYTGEDENIASQNRYCYTINNSYKYVDPDGHFAFLLFGAIALGAASIGVMIAAGRAAIAYKLSNKKGKGHSKKKDKKNETTSNKKGDYSGGGGGGRRSSMSHKDNKTINYKETKKEFSDRIVNNFKKKKKNPDVCPSRKDINKAIDILCNQLQAEYFKKYSDKGARKVISKTINELRLYGKKKQNPEYVQKKCNKYRKGMKLPPYTTDNGVTYLANSLISLNGFAVSKALINECVGDGNYTFTMNVSEYNYSEPVSVQTTMVKFSVKIPYFSSDIISIRIGVAIEFVNISLVFKPKNGIKIEGGISIALGIKGGVKYSTVNNPTITLSYVSAVGVGLSTKTTINISDLIVPVK